jgi:hypothetical protein
MCTGSIPGVKRPERGADHTTSFYCRDLERVGLYLYSPSRPHRRVIGSTFKKIMLRTDVSGTEYRVVLVKTTTDTAIFNQPFPTNPEDGNKMLKVR